MYWKRLVFFAKVHLLCLQKCWGFFFVFFSVFFLLYMVKVCSYVTFLANILYCHH